MIFSLSVQRTGREKPVDYVGLLKVQTPADVGLDSDSAQLSDMIHNPTWSGLCLIRHKLESLPSSTITGYEAIHMIRKGQACGSAPGGRAVLLHRFIFGLFSAVAV
jgi:hypothetical protein